MRVEDLALQPVHEPTSISLTPNESISAALLRVRDRRENEFSVVDRGVVLGMVRRGDLLALAASDRMSREID